MSRADEGMRQIEDLNIGESGDKAGLGVEVDCGYFCPSWYFGVD